MTGLALSLAGLLLTAGCGGEGDEASATKLAPDRYVDVMARLALVDTAMTTSVQVGPLSISPDSARRLILERWSVTGDELVSFARVASRDPARMQKLWERVMSTADSLREAGWTPESEPDAGG